MSKNEKVILCVDDEQIVLSSLETQLRRYFGDEYIIELAQNANDALEIIDELKEDNLDLELIISDFIMPGMTGDKLLIKTHELLPDVKKVLLTGQANLEGVTNIINHGALYRYISKPWEENDLIITVKEALKSYMQAQEIKFYTKHLEELVEEKIAENKTYLEIVNKYLIASKTDINGTITDVSDALCKVSGYTKEELIGQNHNILKHPDMPLELYTDLWNTIKAGEVWSGEIKNKKKNGEEYWVYAQIQPNYNKEKEIIGFASIRIDITDKKIIEKLSITDPLTNLYNRRHYNQVFEKELNRAKRENKKLGFVIFDIDFFKPYNDYYGHLSGDNVLKEIAKTISSSLTRSSDYSFRLGGEEFGILTYDTNLESLNSFINKLRASIEDLNINHEKSTVSQYVTASFGGVVFNSNNTNINIEDIYKFADDLLYEVKNTGKNDIKIKELA